MSNPLNQLPADANMVRRVDEVAAQFAKETGHMVFMIVMKENGKCHITAEGVPETGWLADMMKDQPTFLERVAIILRVSQALDDKQPRS